MYFLHRQREKAIFRTKKKDNLAESDDKSIKFKMIFPLFFYNDQNETDPTP
jgi:hypothetical protein